MYPQSMFWSKTKKNRNTPANPSFFFYIKVVFKGVFITRTRFRDAKKNRRIYVRNTTTAIFLIFAQNIDCTHTLEPPRRGGSHVCPQSKKKTCTHNLKKKSTEDFQF